jgi:hypothetical protein
MAKVGTINKTKGVNMIADWLYSGKDRKEIIQLLAKLGGVSDSTVDKWIKAARPIIQQRRQAAEDIRIKVEAELIEEVARELGISRKTQLAELHKLAYMDIRKLYQPTGELKNITELDDHTAGSVCGVEVFEEHDKKGNFIGTSRKVKRDSKITALAEINKLMGYYPVTVVKGKIDEPDGEGRKFSVTLNLG